MFSVEIAEDQLSMIRIAGYRDWNGIDDWLEMEYKMLTRIL